MKFGSKKYPAIIIVVEILVEFCSCQNSQVETLAFEATESYDGTLLITV